MPVRGSRDPLPRRPERLLVAGGNGAGKTTLARSVAEILGCPHVELDSLHYGPGWSTRPGFLDDVRRIAAEASWVSEWQYDDVRDVLLARADLLVWLDLPMPVVMFRVLRRTVRRRVRREVLWNSNAEPPLRHLPQHLRYILCSAWRSHVRSSQRVAAACVARPDLVVVRLTSPAQIAAWTDGPLRARALI